MLEQEQKNALLKLARESIVHYLDKGIELTPSVEEFSFATRAAGVFVTLKERDSGHLRGCIGQIESDTPIFKNVGTYACHAAFRDPRFSPVDKTELDNLHLEISIIGPVTKVENLEDIEVGTHGLICRHPKTQGLLLPQVATEWNWDRMEFIKHTCQKAGLPQDAYQWPETEFQYFTVELFAEPL